MKLWDRTMGHAKMVKKSHVIAATRKNNFTYIYLYITFYIVDQLLVSKRTRHVDIGRMLGRKINRFLNDKQIFNIQYN